MKNYLLIFEDKHRNELKTSRFQAINITDARRIKDIYFNCSLLNDLFKIKVKKEPEELKYYNRKQ